MLVYPLADILLLLGIFLHFKHNEKSMRSRSALSDALHYISLEHLLRPTCVKKTGSVNQCDAFSIHTFGYCMRAIGFRDGSMTDLEHILSKYGVSQAAFPTSSFSQQDNPPWHWKRKMTILV